MKTQIKNKLQILQKEHAKLDNLVSIQYAPYYYNRKRILIKERIDTIYKIVIDFSYDVENMDVKLMLESIDLLHKYIELLQKYYMNHPWKPQSK